MRNLFNIPNALTLCNLICGCLAIKRVFLLGLNSHYDVETVFVQAFFLLMIAAVFDFFDGFAARLLKIQSPIGKDLDSLADVVTFGVAPGFIVLQFLKYYLRMYYPALADIHFDYIALLIPAFSALRLAKFNNDSRQNLGFIGIPTPANSLFFASLVLLQINTLLLVLIVLICIPIFCYLMISEIPLFALKFKSFAWKENQIKYIFLGICGILIILLRLQAMPFIILTYVILSIANNQFTRK